MGGYKQSYLTVASGTLGPIPFLAIFALIVGIFFWFPVSYTHLDVYKRQGQDPAPGAAAGRAGGGVL